MIRATVMVAALLVASSASAQWRPSGAMSAFVLVEVDAADAGLGGGLMLDVWHNFGVLQLGMAAGIGAVTSDNEDTNRIFTPVAATIGIGVAPSPVGVRAYVRGGVWGGATNVGLRGGGYMSGGAAMDIRLDHTVSIGLSVEAWRLWGGLKRFLIVPSLSLVWRLGDQSS